LSRHVAKKLIGLFHTGARRIFKCVPVSIFSFNGASPCEDSVTTSRLNLVPLLALLRHCHSAQKSLPGRDCAEVLTKCCAQHVLRGEDRLVDALDILSSRAQQ
jgi:hypothetical protein